MATYTVQPNQNIWDISILLYGNIEGVFDLLISNPHINIDSDLKAGDKLNYHSYFKVNEGIVSALNSEELVPANGERHVYFKETDLPLRAILRQTGEISMVSFQASGSGTITVDWGDNSELETITLSSQPVLYEHYFDNVSESRNIKFYGEFLFGKLDASLFNGDFYVTKPLHVEEFISRANHNSIRSLFLFEEIAEVDLQASNVQDLLPLYDLSLQKLNLKDVRCAKKGAMNDYLIYIADNYGTRRSCTVMLSEEPSPEGLEAIQKIINEPAWNSAGKWKFIVGDTTYAAL